MTKRTYTQKDGTIWEWEETQEVIEALKKLHENPIESKTTTVG